MHSNNQRVRGKKHSAHHLPQWRGGKHKRLARTSTEQHLRNPRRPRFGSNVQRGPFVFKIGNLKVDQRTAAYQHIRALLKPERGRQVQCSVPNVRLPKLSGAVICLAAAQPSCGFKTMVYVCFTRSNYFLNRLKLVESLKIAAASISRAKALKRPPSEPAGQWRRSAPLPLKGMSSRRSSSREQCRAGPSAAPPHQHAACQLRRADGAQASPGTEGFAQRVTR